MNPGTLPRFEESWSIRVPTFPHCRASHVRLSQRERERALLRVARRVAPPVRLCSDARFSFSPSGPQRSSQSERGRAFKDGREAPVRATMWVGVRQISADSIKCRFEAEGQDL